MRLLLAGNGPYANRGCEALVRCTVRLIREVYPQAEFVVASDGGPADQVDEQEPGVTHHLLQAYPHERGWTAGRVLRGLARRRRRQWDIPTSWPLVRRCAREVDAVLLVGGDLYGLSHGKDQLLNYLGMGEEALRTGAPYVVWGASLGPFPKEGRLGRFVREHLRRCTLILCREEDSRRLLEEMGITRNVRLVADPAFLLEQGAPSVELPADLSDCVGVNLAAVGADMIGLDQRQWVSLSAECVLELSRELKTRVVLIPHESMWPDGRPTQDEGAFLSQVCAVARDRGGDCVALPSSMRSWELKWVIGQLRAFAGLKTHSTIAGFSSCVPTLCIAYSPKAWGLSRSMLGTDRHVLPLEALSPGNFAGSMERLIAEGPAIRRQLAGRLPEMQSRARLAAHYLKETLEEGGSHEG